MTKKNQRKVKSNETGGCSIASIALASPALNLPECKVQILEVMIDSAEPHDGESIVKKIIFSIQVDQRIQFQIVDDEDEEGEADIISSISGFPRVDLDDKAPFRWKIVNKLLNSATVLGKEINSAKDEVFNMAKSYSFEVVASIDNNHQRGNQAVEKFMNKYGFHDANGHDWLAAMHHLLEESGKGDIEMVAFERDRYYELEEVIRISANGMTREWRSHTDGPNWD